MMNFSCSEFWVTFMNYFIMFIITLVMVSFFTLFERKILSYIQMRVGPNKVGIVGLFQAFADGIKLFTNEYTKLYKSQQLMYLISPFLMFVFSYILWIFYPYMWSMMKFNNFIMLIICFLSIGVYPLMFAGVYSNSIYSNLGGIRSIVQTISYEVSFILLLFSFLMIFESMTLNYSNNMYMNLTMLNLVFPMSIVLYISILAELNRTPFDFSEGESELISGYNIEYSSGLFAVIFLSEYSNILFLMMIYSLMNFTHFFIIFMFFMLMIYYIIMLRADLPRLRYDKMMYLNWLILLPLILNYLIYLIFMKFYLFM